jgi:mannose-1-phosphate guanylyltransferase
MVGEESLLAATVSRVAPLGPVAVMVGPQHVSACRATIPSIERLIEPAPRGTAAAVLAAAAWARDGLVLVLPADHVVGDEVGFRRAVVAACSAAVSGALVLFGVQPTRPATGFGWIAVGDELIHGARSVRGFVEKPSLDRAERLLASGDHLWNGGIFLFDAAALWARAERLEPAMCDAVRRAVEDARADGQDTWFGPTFTDARAVSFDVAVVERCDGLAVVSLDVGWDDLGSWDAVGRAGRRDPDGNVTVGPVEAVGCRGSVLWSDGPSLRVVGAVDLAVAATRDGVLVLPRARSEEAKGADLVAPPRWHAIDEGPGYQLSRRAVCDGEIVDEHGRAATWSARGAVTARVNGVPASWPFAVSASDRVVVRGDGVVFRLTESG